VVVVEVFRVVLVVGGHQQVVVVAGHPLMGVPELAIPGVVVEVVVVLAPEQAEQEALGLFL
jgi:hypothetical protein